MFRRLTISSDLFAYILILGTVAFGAEPSDKSVTAQSQTGEIIRRAPVKDGEQSRRLSQAEDEVLVRFKSTSSESVKTSAHTRVGTTRLKRFRVVSNLEVVKLPRGVSVEQAIKSYRTNPNVLYAEPNYRVEALGIPNDPFFGSQWGLRNTGQSGGTAGADIKAAQAWGLTTGSTDVVVVVIDTGVDYNHVDLAANMWRNAGDCNSNGLDDDGNGYADDCYGIDTFNHDSDPMDDHNHGTHVAGIIGAVGNNSIGVAGVNWTVKIMPCKFLSADGSGYLSGAIECLEYVKTMKERGINIIATNNSWGGGGFSQALYDAIDDQRQLGILFVVAAGNDSFDNDTWPLFPASYHLSNIISVAATDRFDQLAFFSDFGRHTVHIGAPGHDILSTTKGSTYSIFSGTSMATPYVTGTAALLKAQDPTRDWKAIKNLILAGGAKIDSMSRTITQRRLNAHGAMTCSNSVVLSRLEPIENALVGYVGVPIDLSALHINCAAPNGDITVAVDPGGGTVVLKDDGLSADSIAADGIYSGQWTPPAEGIYNLNFPSGDAVAVRVVTQQTSGMFRPYTTIPISPSAISSSPEAVAIGDVTGDGKNDVVMSTSFYFDPDNDYKIHVFVQQANGDLQRVAKYPTGGYPTSIAIGDVNNDGKADVVVANSGQGVAVFLQDNAGNLASPVVYPTTNSYKVRVADVNDDGRLDVITIGAGTVAIFFQNGQGSLEPAVTYAVTDVTTGGLEVADVNNDGRKDIVVMGFEERVYPRIAVLLQNSDGTFAPPVFHPLGFYMPFTGGIAAGDVNGDGRNDVVMAFGGNSPSPFIAVFLQNEAGDLDRPELYPAYEIPGAIKIADVNKDGKNDIILSHDGWGTVTVYLQAPNGSLFPPDMYLSTYGNSNMDSMAVGDIDGDGLPDIVIGDHENNTGRSSLVVFHNDLHVSRETRKITLYVSGNGAGRVVSHPPGLDCSSVCSADFPLGITVTFKGVPEPGSYQTGWGWFPSAHPGCSLFTDGDDCLLTIRETMDISTGFSTLHPPLKISKVGTGSGTVTSSPLGINCGPDCQETYPEGTIVQLTAVPDPGSTFVEWTNSCLTNNPCSIAIKAGDGFYNEAVAWFDSMMAISSPVFGDTWSIQSKEKIQWSRTSTSRNRSNVRIDLSRDGGATWTPIIKKAANSGLKAWKVTGPATPKAKLRVCNLSPVFCTESYEFAIR